MPVPMIEAADVVKSFTVRTRSGGLRRARRTVRAVDGVSFTVEPGEFVGYLGPNGAGKSTTIKMLTGILTASSGTLRVCGLDPSRRRTVLARRIGVVFGQRTTLWWDLPLRDSLTLVRRLYRVEAAAHRARLAELTALLGWSRSWTPRSGSSASASGCAATSPPRCCTTRSCSSWTSRRSAWTW